jgi:hypothetical protein
MQLIPEWKRIVRRAWSLRLIVLAGVLSAGEVVLPLFSDAVPRGQFALLALLTTVGAAIARVVAQPEAK